jgi:hypothetical protein
MKLTTTLALGAFALIGCTTENYYTTDSLPPLERPATTTTKPRPTTTLASVGMVSTSEFLRAVRDESVSARYMDDADLLQTGWANCEAIDRGATSYDLATAMAETAGADYELGNLLAALAAMATVWLCPEHFDVWTN